MAKIQETYTTIVFQQNIIIADTQAGCIICNL